MNNLNRNDPDDESFRDPCRIFGLINRRQPQLPTESTTSTEVVQRKLDRIIRFFGDSFRIFFRIHSGSFKAPFPYIKWKDQKWVPNRIGWNWRIHRTEWWLLHQSRRVWFNSRHLMEEVGSGRKGGGGGRGGGCSWDEMNFSRLLDTFSICVWIRLLEAGSYF